MAKCIPNVNCHLPQQPARPSQDISQQLPNPQHLEDVSDIPSIDLDLDLVAVDTETLIHHNWTEIKSQVVYMSDFYNLYVKNINLDYIRRFLWILFHDQRHAFKINAYCGYVVRNFTDGSLLYFHAGLDEPLFEGGDEKIYNKVDFDKFVEKFESLDLEGHCKPKLPNTAYMLEMITNIQFRVTRLNRRHAK
jgi:hypothetical protein